MRAPFLLTDVKSNAEQKEFKRILIVATGSSGARLFLDRLTNVLNSKFASENVTTSYDYLGYVPDEKIEIDKRFKDIIQNKSFDAVLYFGQSDKPINPVQINDFINRNSHYRIVRYQQTFSIQLFEFLHLQNAIWETELRLNFDFTQSPVYLSIADKIIGNLKLNKIVR